MHSLRGASIAFLAILSGCAASPGEGDATQTQTQTATEALTATPEGSVQASAWRPVNVGMTSGVANALAVSPTDANVAYAAMGANGGVYKTTNGQSAAPTWSFVGFPGTRVTTLLTDPKGNVYAVAGHTLYESKDFGSTWPKVWSSPAGDSITSVTMDPTTPSILFLTTATGLFKSVDGGLTATLVLASNKFLGVTAIAPSNPKIVYVAATEPPSGLPLPQETPPYRSTDGGATWTQLPPVPGAVQYSMIYTIAVDPLDPLGLYVCNSKASFKLVAGAWKSVPSLYGDTIALAIAPPGKTSYALRWGSGLQTSNDGGATWQRTFTNARGALAVQAGHPEIAYLGGTQVEQDPHPLYRTSDGGATWSNISQGVNAGNAPSVVVAPSNPSTVYASVFAAGIYRSTDGASTWSPLPLPATAAFGGVPIGVSASNPNHVYVGTQNGVYTFADASSSAPAKLVLTQFATTQVAVAPSDNRTVYAPTYSHGVSVTRDGGATWSTALPTDSVYWVVVDPTNAAIAYAEVGADSGPSTPRSLYRTTDHGASWVRIDSHPFAALAVDPTNPKNLFAATDDAQTTFYRSVDGGASWSPLASFPNASSPTQPNNLVPLAIDPHTPTTLYAGPRNGGIWRSSDSGHTWLRTGLDGWSPLSLAIDPKAPTTLYAAVANGGLFKTTTGGL